MGMSFDGLAELAEEIRRQGFDEETASRFAALIGDTPIIDDAGKVVVRDGGRELARLKLHFFEDRP